MSGQITEVPVSGTYNATQADMGRRLLPDTSVAPVIINLPQIATLPANFDELRGIDINANASNQNITINAFAGDTINGNASVTIASDELAFYLFIAGPTKRGYDQF